MNTMMKGSLVKNYLFYHIFRNECIAARLVEILTKEKLEILPVQAVSSEDYQIGCRDGQYLEGTSLSSDHRYDIKLFNKDYEKVCSENFEIDLGKIARRVANSEETDYQNAIKTYCNGETKGHPRRPVTLIFLCDVACTAGKTQVMINNHPFYYSSRTQADGTFQVITVNMKSNIINARIGDLTPLFDYMHTLDFAQVEKTYRENGMHEKLYRFLSELDGCVCEFLASSYEKQKYLQAHASEERSYEAGVKEALDTIKYLLRTGRVEDFTNLVSEKSSEYSCKMVRNVRRERKQNGEDVSPIHETDGLFPEEDDPEEEELPAAEDAKNGEEILLDIF